MDAVQRDFVERVRERLGERLVSIHLFGSRARGDCRPWSDHDLLVVVRGDRRPARDEVSWVDLEVLLEHGANVSPKVVTEEQFQARLHDPSPFWRNFRRDEVLLWPTQP